MSGRVDEREWLEYQWDYLKTFLGGERRIEELAYEARAFARKRKVASPADRLRLLLLWAAGDHSLGETAALAAAEGLADLSDVALLKRFAKCGDWIMALLTEVLVERKQHDLVAGRLRLIDATIVAAMGSKRNNDHRIHLGYNATTGRIDHIELTSMKAGEDLTRFDFEASDVVIADRGYGRRGGLCKVADSGARFIVRIGWQNLPLECEDGTPFDVLSALRSLEEAAPDEFRVQLRGDPARRPCRLVAIRNSEPAAQESRRKLLTSSRKDQRNLDPRSLEVCGYVFVLTNLDASVTSRQVLDLYALRWQVEIRFKSLKSVVDLNRLPVRNFDLAQTYLAAKLLVAVLIEQLVLEYESFSPWGYPLVEAASPLAADENPS
jgi:catechol 2,3-dioxygenase-like lactoylglutathione lyase family enzyme